MPFWAFPERRAARSPEQMLALTGEPSGVWLDGTSDIDLMGYRPERYLPVCYACLRFISTRLSALPYQVVDSSGRVLPPPRWLATPAEWLAWDDFVSASVVSLIHHGNLYYLPMFDAAGVTTSVAVPSPTSVSVRLTDGKLTYTVRGTVYPEAVVHERWMVMPGEVIGLGALDAARKVMSVDRASIDYLDRHFTQGAQLQYVLSTPGNMSDEQRDRVAAQVHRRMVGATNAWTPLIVDGGLNIDAVSMTAEQAKFLELSQWTDARIATQVYGLPASVVGGADSYTGAVTYQNIGDRDAGIWRDALRPIARRIETAVSWLLPQGQRFRFDPRPMVGGSQRERLSTAATMAGINSQHEEQVFTADEIREAAGFDPLASGGTTGKVA